MATRYEYYNTGEDAQCVIDDDAWSAQTFTPSVSHKITSVKILVARIGSPKAVTVAINALNESGHPDGVDLCSGVINGDAFPDDNTEDPDWFEITLGAGCVLSASTGYAIVVKALHGDHNNWVNWYFDQTAATYAGGYRAYSVDAGVFWEHEISDDYMFEEWGDPILAPTVSTDPATNLVPTPPLSATLNGTLDDDGGEACDCGFEYGLTTGYGNTTPTDSKNTGETFSQVITGLLPNHTYHFRAFGTNGAGTGYGIDRTFEITMNKGGNINASKLTEGGRI